jgi:hypothetical protein
MPQASRSSVGHVFEMVDHRRVQWTRSLSHDNRFLLTGELLNGVGVSGVRLLLQFHETAASASGEKMSAASPSAASLSRP